MLTFTLIVLVIAVLVLGTVAHQLMKLRLSPPVFRTLTNDEFPAHAMDLLQPMATELATLGMTFSELRHERRSTGEDSWQAIFHNADGSIWATCETYVVAKQDKTRLLLQTHFVDGSVALTCNDAYSDISIPPSWRLIQKPFDSCAEQEKAHRGSVLGSGHVAERLHRVLSADEYRERCAALDRTEQAHLQQTGHCVPTASDPHTLRMSWTKIPWMTLRVLWMAFAQRQEKKKPPVGNAQSTAAGAANPNAGPEMRRLELYREETGKESFFGKLGWTGKGLVFLLSMVAFMAFFYFRGTLELSTLGWIVVILIIHELGHAVTMRIFGYRNVQIFFIPMFGAAASGIKKRVPAWQEFWVSVMGPLPGLVLGWAIMGWAILQPEQVPDWLEEFALWSLILNGFNLLPFLPLDGGRIVETLIFNRLPTFRIVFIILGALAMLPLALLSWWFLFLAIIMFMTIPEASKLASMAHIVRLNLKPEDTEDEALLKTFQIIEQTGHTTVFDKPTWPAFVDRVVQMGCGKRMGFFGTTASLGLYAMLIGLPVLLGIGVAFKAGWDHAEQEQELTDRIVALEEKVTWPTTEVSAETGTLLDACENAYWDAQDEADLMFDELDDDVESLMERTLAAQQESRLLFASATLPSARKVRWNEAPAWIAEDEYGERQMMIAEIVEALITNAGSQIADDKHAEAGRDLIIAYWAIASCEPRQSFSQWQAWIDLERQCLNGIEQVSAHGAFKDGSRTWLATSMRSAPRPTGSKIALLSLYDANEFNTLLDASLAIPNEEGYEEESTGFGWHTLSQMFFGAPLDDQLKVAAYWDAQAEAAAVPVDQIEDVALGASWNDAIRRIRHTMQYRELGALVLSGEADPTKSPVTIGTTTISLVNDFKGHKWIIQFAGGDHQDEVAWRIPEVPSPKLPEMTQGR